MDNATTQKLKEIIAKSGSIGIAVGQNPSLDEMAAALSLYLLLQSAKKRVSIACPTDPIVEISNLVGIDRVQRSFGGDAGDLVVAFPYKEGEIEKVSYTLENNFLNIIVKSSEQGLSFTETDVKYTRGSGSIDLLIVVGAAQLSDIGDVIDSQKLANISVVNIDNDPNNQGYGDVVIVSRQASSVSEHVADIALILGFAIAQDEAQNLMSGIMGATDDFKNPRTSALAFEIASILMKSGAQRSVSARPQFQSNGASPFGTQVNTAPAMPQPIQQPQAVQQPQSVQQPMPQPMPSSTMPEQFDKAEKAEVQNEKPPLDWLTPKVYKGSSEV